MAQPIVSWRISWRVYLITSPFMNFLSKKRRTMRRVMRKPQSMLFKIFAARLTKMNNFLLILSESDASKKMNNEDLNNFLLCAVPNAWVKESYLQICTLSWILRGKLVLCSSKRKFLKISTKGKYLLKHPLGQMPTVTIMSGNVWEDNLPFLPTARRVTLASSR